MAEEVEECSSNKLSFLEKSNIKEEFKDDSCIDIFETSISANYTELKDNVWDDRINEYQIANTVHDIKTELSTSEGCNIELTDNVKIEYKIDPDHIKIEFDKLSFCDHCNEHYEDYCTRCGMLARILNGTILSITDGRAVREIPNDILEIRESSGRVGVFALKIIPECVKIGPFNGLGTSECPRRLKGGKFIVTEDKSDLLNWMQYINPAKNIFQQNLIPFQHEDKLYYHSNREILADEELRVYFGEEYEDSVNKDIEMDFIAPAEVDVKDVFACTPCCLGFSSRGYLAKHKSTCPNETNGKFSFDELAQCPFCNIIFYEKEYRESHMPYCCKRNVRKYIPLSLDKVKVNRRKTRRLQIYRCTQCKYKTSYKSILRSHFNKHYEVKIYKCEICSGRFNTKRSLKLHVKYIHIGIPKDQKWSMKDYMQGNTKVYRYSRDKAKQCLNCKFQTKYKYKLETHIKSKHRKQFSYGCEYKTSINLKEPVKSTHLKQFSYECETCDYKTNRKSNLQTHVKSRHLKQFTYECEICDYKSNTKAHFKAHVKSIHLKQFSYECEICDYTTNHKQALDKHIKSKHLKQFSFECDMCYYKTNHKSDFEKHTNSKHLKQFSYECEICDYKTNRKPHLEIHVKSIHLKQYSYECEICDYKTNQKQAFETHGKSKHLKQFSYECEIRDYKF